MTGTKSFFGSFYAVRSVVFFVAFLLAAGCAGMQKVQTTDAKPPVKAVAEVKAPAAVERQTAEGIVIGLEDEATGTNSWKAIPYAKPPVDGLRWRAPQAPEKPRLRLRKP